MKGQSPNHPTTREFSLFLILITLESFFLVSLAKGLLIFSRSHIFVIFCFLYFLLKFFFHSPSFLFCTGECVCVCVCVCVCACLSRVQLLVTLWTVQALSMGFSRQEYWCGLPCPPSGHLPDPAIKPMSLMSPALAGRFFTTSATWEALLLFYCSVFCVSVHWSLLLHSFC